MKKSLCLLMVVLMVIGAVGCAQPSTPPAEATPAETAPTEATPAEAAPAEATPAEASSAPDAATVKDGTYSVVSKGMGEGLKIEVTFVDGKISDVKILEHNETAGVSDPAIENMPAQIVEKNSVNVDVVSGATMTSNGIIEGVKQAIIDAGGKVEDFGASAAQ